MEVTLQGKRILVTRERAQAKEFSEKIRRHQGQPVEVPLLTVSCKDKTGNRELMQSVSNYDWVFFTSANGVHCFFDWAQHFLHSEDRFTGKFAVVGHKTDKALRKYGYTATFIPTVYNADVMSKEFLAAYPDPGSILLIRGNRSREVLPAFFYAHGISFDQVEVYETTFNFHMKEKLNKLLENNEVEFITFTSPSTVEAFCEMATKTDGFDYVCIGTTTEKKAKELGLSTIITPDEFTIEAMINCISKYISAKG